MQADEQCRWTNPAAPRCTKSRSGLVAQKFGFGLGTDEAKEHRQEDNGEPNEENGRQLLPSGCHRSIVTQTNLVAVLQPCSTHHKNIGQMERIIPGEPQGNEKHVCASMHDATWETTWETTWEKMS